MRWKQDWKEWVKLGFLALVLSGAVYLDFDCKCTECDKNGEASSMATLSPSNTSYQLKAPGADKECHAEFSLTVYWMDLDRRLDPNALSPYSDSSDMYYDFRSSKGSFVLFPLPPRKDSSPPYYKWVWEIDIGAKNEPDNPTTYEIRCWCNGLSRMVPPPGKPDWWDIIVSGEIKYTEYSVDRF